MDNCCRFVKFCHKRNTCKKKNEDIPALELFFHDSQSEISPFGTFLLINISFYSNRKMKFLFVLLLVLCHRAAQNADPSEYFALVRCFF